MIQNSQKSSEMSINHRIIFDIYTKKALIFIEYMRWFLIFAIHFEQLQIIVMAILLLFLLMMIIRGQHHFFNLHSEYHYKSVNYHQVIIIHHCIYKGSTEDHFHWKCCSHTHTHFGMTIFSVWIFNYIEIDRY